MASGTSGFQWTWDDALKSFAGTNQSVVTRTDVTSIAGSGSSANANGNANSGSNSGSVPMGADWIQLNGGWHCEVYELKNGFTLPHHDVRWDFPFQLTDGFGNIHTYVIIVGCDLNWNQWMDGTAESPGDPFYKFMKQAWTILDALVGSPGRNDSTDPGSFDAAVAMVGDIQKFLQHWAPQVKKLSDSLHVHGSDWQGSAAGEFKALLDGVVNEFTDLLNMMSQPTDILTSLTADRDKLLGTLTDLQTIFLNWQEHVPEAWPINCVHNVLYEIMYQSHFYCAKYMPTSGLPTFYIITPNRLNPISQEFWNQLEVDAKQRWTSTLTTYVDPSVGTTMDALDLTFVNSVDALSMGLGQVALTMPPAPNTGLNMPLGGPGGGNLNLNSLIGPNTGTGGNLNGLIGPNTGAGGSEVILPNGKPFLDPKTHKPFEVPAGSTIDQNGNVLDAFGNPVMGPNNKPLKVPAGSTIKSSSSGSNSPGGNLTVPKGSKVGSNGSVVDSQGHKVLDTNGNPIVLPHGAKILADGTVVDANGNPISANQQLLTDEQAALNPNTQPITLPPALTTNVPTVGGLGGLSGSGLSGGLGTLSNPNFLAGTPTMSLSPQALQNSAMVANGLGATQFGASQSAAAQQALAAAEEAQLAGKGLTASASPPYMPPMGGMGAGMGAGGNPNEKDRQRTTWLSEDEEVWGTESQSVEGVIGR